MRRCMIAGVVLLVLGAGLMAVGLIAGVLGGGVPYHDGPNAGHTSEPGLGRVLEESSYWLMLGGLCAAALGFAITVMAAAIWWASRRRG